MAGLLLAPAEGVVDYRHALCGHPHLRLRVDVVCRHETLKELDALDALRLVRVQIGSDLLERCNAGTMEVLKLRLLSLLLRSCGGVLLLFQLFEPGLVPLYVLDFVSSCRVRDLLSPINLPVLGQFGLYFTDEPGQFLDVLRKLLLLGLRGPCDLCGFVGLARNERIPLLFEGEDSFLCFLR